MLNVIISYLRAVLMQVYPDIEVKSLCEKLRIGTDKEQYDWPHEYCSDGNYNGLDFDNSKGLIYFRSTGPVDIREIDEDEEAACGYSQERKYAMRLVGFIPKNYFNTDNEFVDYKLAENTIKAIAFSTIKELSLALKANRVEVKPTRSETSRAAVYREEMLDAAKIPPTDKGLFYIDFNIIVTGNLSCFEYWDCNDAAVEVEPGQVIITNGIDCGQLSGCQTIIDINAELADHGTRIGDLETGLSQEITDRQEADNVLQENIDNETTARINADITLQSNVNAEASARSAADITLQNNIDAEVSARASADGAESSARAAADTTLQGNITAEATTRSNNDATLQSEIDALAVLIDTSMKKPEAFTPAGSYPTTYGGIAIQAGDTFRLTAAGAVGGVTVNGEDLLIALIDSPGQADANWQVIESNRDQATESVKGVAKIAAQATIEDSVTTNDTDIVTPKKWWQGFAKGLTLSSFLSAVLGTVLTGLSLATGTAVASTDTILVGIGKLQTQITNLISSLSAYALLSSPAFTGAPTAPTAAAYTNSAQIATTAYVDGKVTRIALANNFTPDHSNPALQNVTGWTFNYLAGEVYEMTLFGCVVNVASSVNGAKFGATYTNATVTGWLAARTGTNQLTPDFGIRTSGTPSAALCTAVADHEVMLQARLTAGGNGTFQFQSTDNGSSFTTIKAGSVLKIERVV